MSGLEPSFFTWLNKIAKNSYLLSPLEMLLLLFEFFFFFFGDIYHLSLT